jgi:hypothetical protein
LTIHLDLTHDPKSITPLSSTARSDQILLAPFHNVMFDLVGGRQCLELRGASRVSRLIPSRESRDKIISKIPKHPLAQERSKPRDASNRKSLRKKVSPHRLVFSSLVVEGHIHVDCCLESCTIDLRRPCSGLVDTWLVQDLLFGIPLTPSPGTRSRELPS